MKTSLKKKAIGILISLVMMLAFILGFSPAALAAECPNVRILLNIGATTEFAIEVNGSYTANDIALTSGNGTYTVKLENEGQVINLYDSDGQLICPVGASGGALPTLILKGTEATNTVSLEHPSYGPRDYLGELRFTVSNGCLRLINHINLEDYLCGVIAYEMSSSFPLEALKAQAVAARTYAANRLKGATGSYDLVDNTNDQVYKGYKAEYFAADSSIWRAVHETAAQVLTYGSDYVQCYYSASNGGWTDITQHRWSTSEPLKSYNIIKPDPYDVANPYSKQEVLILPKAVNAESPLQYKQQVDGCLTATENSPASIANASLYMRLLALPKVAEKGYIAGVSNDIEILGFSNIVTKTYDNLNGQHHGGANGYDGNDVTGKNDCKDMTQADVTMTVLASRYATPDDNSGYLLGDVDMNGSISISDYTLVRLHLLGIKALSGDALTIADVDRNGSVSISDYTLIRLHILGIKTITARTNDGLVKEPVEVTFTINFPDMDVGGAYQSFFDGSLGLFTVESDDTNWYIYQRRFGHAIGMSQRGAQQRAMDPDPAVNTYTAILDFYYPDYSDNPAYPTTELTSLY